MALSPEQIGRLLQLIQHTHDVELTCPECLDQLDAYVQGTLDGMPLEGLLDQVREHLEACPCCHDQYTLVLETLKAIEES